VPAAIFDETSASRSSSPRSTRTASPGALEGQGEVDLAVRACEHGHRLIPPLTDAAPQRWEVQRDLVDLQVEQESLVAQKPPSSSPPTRPAASAGSTSRFRYRPPRPASRTRHASSQLEAHTLALGDTLFRALQAHNRRRIARLEEVGAQLRLPAPIPGLGVSDAAITAHEALTRTRKEEKAAIEAGLPSSTASARSRPIRATSRCLRAAWSSWTRAASTCS